MNNRIIISTDCTCDLPDELLEKYSIQIVPFYILMKDIRFQDYTEVTSTSLLEYVEQDNEKISSMPPSVEDYRAHFLKLAGEEKRTIIHASISSKLSDAYMNARDAAADMDNVFVINSGIISHGLGIFVLRAAELASRNAPSELILSELKKIQPRISTSFILKTTSYLANNNRLNTMRSNLLSLFKIKPILRIKNNEMTVDGAFIGSRTSYAKKYIRKVLKDKKNISDEILFIAVSGCSEEFQQIIIDEATKLIKWKKIYIHDVSATNFCNIGPGSIGVMFCTQK